MSSLRGVAAGCLLISASIGLYFLAGFGQHRGDGSLVLARLAVPDAKVALAFKAPSTASYRLGVAIDRAYPFRETECLLGVGMPHPASTQSGERTDCPPGYAPPQFTWTIRDVATETAVAPSYEFPDHAGGYGPDYISRDFAVFRLERGRSYRLEAGTKDASLLMERAHPRFVVGLDPMEVENALFRNTVSSLASVGLALAGLIILLRSLMQRIRHRSEP